MPADYVACRDSLIKKGVSEKTAKRRCAIWFYKKHGISVNEAHKKGKGAFPDEPDLDDDDWSAMELISADLDKIGNQVESTKPEAHGDEEEFKIEAINMDFLDEFGVVEIVSTKVGATAFTHTGQAVTWTERVLKKVAGTWKLGNVSINHNGKTYGKIIDSFYDNGLLRQVVKVNDTLKGWLKKFGKHVGVSIEASKVKINKKMDIADAFGTGVTFVFPPEVPACPIDEGCGIMGTETEAVHHTPPEAGKLPESGKKILDKVYNECRKKYSSESAEDKTRCSKIARSAVRKAGWTEDKDGNWHKAEGSIPDEQFDVEAFMKECECEEETPVEGTISTAPTNPWLTVNTANINTTADITGNYIYVPGVPDWNPNIKITYTTSSADPPINISEENKKPIETKEIGDNMVDEKPAETICAKKHESMMKEKDSQIEALKKELEVLNGTVALFNAEKKAKLLETLKNESGLDVKVYESKDIPVIEDILATLRAIKEKEAKEPEVNSGAEVKATEQQTNPTGNAASQAIDDAAKKAEEDAKRLAEEIARINAKAEAFDGKKR